MKKTKKFTQYKEGCFRISIVIKDNGNIRAKNELRLYNKEKQNEYGKQYWKDNKEKIKIQQKEYNNTHKEEKKKYHQKNKESISEYYKNYWKDNKERVKLQQKEYNKDNKEKGYKRRLQWRRDNPERIAQYNSSRRNLGYKPINKNFKGSHFHHMHIDDDPDIGIHIPGKLHNSVWHSRNNKESMNKINNLAFEWLENNKDY